MDLSLTLHRNVIWGESRFGVTLWLCVCVCVCVYEKERNGAG